MQTYNAVIRLGGSMTSELYKAGVTAAELILLQALHGRGSVARLERAGGMKVKPASERERLISLYGFDSVSKVFGSSEHAPLPTEFPEADKLIRQAPVRPLDADELRAQMRAEIMAELANGSAQQPEKPADITDPAEEEPVISFASPVDGKPGED